MATTANEIFVNLPVKDLKATMDFYGKIGFEFNAQFTDEKAACMVVNEHTFVMLLVEDFFKSFTGKAVPDAAKSAEVIVGLSADSRAMVDEIVNTALAAGGTPLNDPVDHGFMYSWGFGDPDGHLWEFIYMDKSAIVPEEKPAAANN